VSGQADIAGAIEHKWAEVGRAARGALVLLGYPEFAHCMPDEADPCGAPAQLHALSYLVTLRAVADHHLDHCGANPYTVAEIYAYAKAGLEADPGCQGIHQ
jgi:hypothetical protein